jgi:4-hydroxy-tetrahydrodipicolinate synthase
MVPWSGVFPAVTTKMREDGSLDLHATQHSVTRLIDSGVSGVIVLPMLGENASLSVDEKVRVIDAAKEAIAGRVPLLTGLAEISTEAATTNAKLFARHGVEGFMVFPSLAYKTDGDETVAWYKSIAAVTELPIMIYNNPIAYGVDVTPVILRELVETRSIVCIKEECGDIRRVTDIFNAVGDRFSVFCGVDDLILESIALGVTGWVSGMTNVWPQECVSIFQLCSSGKFSEALDLYRIMTPAFHLDTHVKLVQYIKLGEHLICGAPEWVRAPRLRLSAEEREQIAQIIERTRRALDSRSQKLG